MLVEVGVGCLPKVEDAFVDHKSKTFKIIWLLLYIDLLLGKVLLIRWCLCSVSWYLS